MSCLNYNRVIIAGRLTAEPDQRMTQSGIPVTAFTVAVSSQRGDNKTTEFIRCVAWRKTAEVIGQYFHKGSAIMLDGKLQTREYTSKDNIKRNITEVVVDNAHFVDSKSDAPTQAPNDGFGDISSDDDLPF